MIQKGEWGLGLALLTKKKRMPQVKMWQTLNAVAKCQKTKEKALERDPSLKEKVSETPSRSGIDDPIWKV